ncbi:30S ribosomal protein S6 [bacterium]|nr:30S ribosomal protein S6 [bacterium]
MFRYEILILTIPEITKDEASTLEFQVEKLVNQFKGSIISFERWGKYRLAYPVRKNDYGVYFLVRFETEKKQSIISELNTLFSVKFSDIVMRKIVSKLDDNQSLEYQKPPSLEDTPKRHISSFLEEKGLLKSNRSKAPEKTKKYEKSTDKVVEEPVKEVSAPAQPLDEKKDSESKKAAVEETKKV